ncbi:MAG: hypothetical protein M3Y74_16460 [Chloroflexota bacterium]|nr:hypothetical protein [Chloroflexota bacterium]
MDKPWITTVIGAVSAALGLALLGTPRRSAALLGLGGVPLLLRAIGVADLIVGMALMRGAQRLRWMRVRAGLNVGLVGLYGWTLLHDRSARRTQGGLIQMLVVSAFDAAVVRRLASRA